MKTIDMYLRFRPQTACLAVGLAYALASCSWAANVVPAGQTLDLGGASTNTADVSAFESLGSVFFDANSPEQDSGVTDPGNPNAVNDKDLRENLPSYLTIGPGSEFGGVSGGWGYQQILVGDGVSPDPFEAGVAITTGSANDNAGELVTFTAGPGVLSDLRVGVIVDILDGAQFAPSSVSVGVGATSATSMAAPGNQIGDIYQFDVTGIVPGDVISVSVGDATAFTSTIAGVVFDVAEPYPLKAVVNTATGNISFVNDSPSGQSASIQGYTISSPSGDLNPAEWNSLQDQGYDGGNTDPHDGIGFEEIGVDADFDGSGDVTGGDFLDWQRGHGTSGNSTTVADGDADGSLAVDGADLVVWERQLGVGSGSESQVGEFRLDGNSSVANGASLDLGQLFTPGGAENLEFQISLGSSVITLDSSRIEYISSVSAAAVPEPGSAMLAVAAMLMTACSTQRRAFSTIGKSRQVAG